MELVVQCILALVGSMFPFRKFFRSISLPELDDQSGEERGSFRSATWWRQAVNRATASLTRVDDRSNSASPLRRQPHPFAMQALGLRFSYNPRMTRLPEWPPPDPPPLTPMYAGAERGNTNPWPPRPWWRRNIQARQHGPVVHVTIDTTDTIDPIQPELTGHFRRTTTEEDNNREPAILTEEEQLDESMLTGFLGDAGSATETLGTATRAQLLIHPGGPEDMAAVERSATLQLPTEEELNANGTSPIENFGLVALNSEQGDEEEPPMFQIYFIVVDSNPAIHREYFVVDPEVNFIQTTVGQTRHFRPDTEDQDFTEEENSNHIGIF